MMLKFSRTYLLLLVLVFGGLLQGKAQRSLKDTLVIDEVVVTGTRNETDIRHLPMSITKVARTQIVERQEPSLIPILTEQVPGLFATSRGIIGYGVSTGSAGGIRMRGVGGNTTTGVLVLIDGHPQYMGLMGHPITDAYQSLLAEKVEVVRGPASVLYGSNAMGGVINIVTRKQPTDGIQNHLSVSYGSYNTLISEYANRVRKGKFSSLVTGSYNCTDGHRANMNFEQYGGYAKIGYDFSRAWNVFADLNLLHFNASNPGSVSSPLLDNDSRVTRGMASIAVENSYTKTSGALKVFYNWGIHKINDGYKPTAAPLDYRFHSNDELFGVNWYQTFSFFQGNRITVGFDYMQNGGSAKNVFNTGKSTDLVDKSIDDVAGYVDFRQLLGDYFTIDAGIRVDRNSFVGTEWIPQVGATYILSQSSQLKAIVGKGFRNPTIRELFMFTPKNPDLKPESLWNYELSYQQKMFDSALAWGINIFYLKGKNMIQTVPVNGRPMNINTGNVENYGLEVEASYRINRVWSISANYSCLKMENLVVAAPEHKLFVGAYFNKLRWSISSGLQYVNGLYTSVNPVEKENFGLWYLRGSYRFNRSLSLFAKGENLLAQSYEINAGYSMPKATISGGFNLEF